MRWGAAAGLLVGIALSAWVLAGSGAGAALALLRAAGWGVAAVIAFHGLQVLCSALAWRTIAGPVQPQPSLAEYVLLRWIREGVNNLLPVVQIGGEVVATRLLRRGGMALADAMAGSVGDMTMETVTHILFTGVGLALLVLLVGDIGTALLVLGGAGAALLAAGGFVAAQWLGLADLAERAVLRLAARAGWASLAGVSGFAAALRGLYHSPARMAWACAQHSMSWLLGGVEVCLALYALGVPVGFAEGMAIEALGQAIKAAGFAVPGAIGVAEGGLVVVCHLFGVAPEAALALGLAKRLREVVFGLPALVAWQMREARPAVERAVLETVAVQAAAGRGAG